MKIAQVCPNYFPYIGGVETLVKETSKRLVENGYDIEVLTTDPSRKQLETEYINGVKIKRFKSWAPNEAYYYSYELYSYLKKHSNDYDIVHAHSYASFPSLFAAMNKDKNKLVFNPHYHGSGHTLFRMFLHVPYKHIGKICYSKSDKILCVSNYEKKLIRKNFNVDENNISIIPNGISVKDFLGIKKTEKDVKSILYVGRLEKYKGIDYILKTLPKLDTDIICEIVGKGPYRKKLVSLAKKLDIEKRVLFLENLPRNVLIQKYVDAEIFILLSKREAYGITVAEALASGTPCIVLNQTALSEWIDNVNCFGVDMPVDIDLLKNLINNVLGQEIGQLELPDWSTVVNDIVNAYHSVI